ncbi:MAG: porin, partial [Pseudolabrys sp.]
WAGFTFGRAQSFFDFYSNPATSYWGAFPGSDTGDGGWFVMGYTAQFGNGFSATIAAEAPRRTQIFGEFAGGTFTGAFGGTNAAGAYGGFQVPDVVGNLRVDQAWGSAQIMAAYHDVNPAYYLGLGTTQLQTISGGPDDHKAGWAVGLGFKVNTPFFGQGDYIQTQFNYTQGALRYVFQTPNSNWGINEGSNASWGPVNDGVYGGFAAGTAAAGTLPTGVELTTAWNVNAAYEHFWNPRWRTSLYGGYAKVEYGSTANNILCTGTTLAVTTPGATGFGCDSNWQTYWVGTRTQWNITKDFYMGLDVMYSKMNTASFGAGIPTIGAPVVVSNRAPLVGGGFAVADDQDNWSFRFRVHRDFYP